MVLYEASQPLVSLTMRGGEDEKEWYSRVSNMRNKTPSTRNQNLASTKKDVGITR